MNRKRVQRIYQEERLMARKRGGCKRALGRRAPIAAPDQLNACGSLDLLHDQMTDGRRFRVLAVVDNCTRECLALVPETSISGVRVARKLDRIIAWRVRSDAPLLVFMNNDVEMIATGWDTRLAGLLSRAEVGALLTYPDGTLQHAGVVMGFGTVCDQDGQGEPGDAEGPLRRYFIRHSVTTVTGVIPRGTAGDLPGTRRV